MSEYRLNERSEQDLREIFLYGLERFGLKVAQAYASDLSRIFNLLAENPRIGRTADGIRPAIRRHEHSSHIILYQETSFGVTILAFAHGRSIRRLRL